MDWVIVGLLILAGWNTFDNYKLKKEVKDMARIQQGEPEDESYY